MLTLKNFTGATSLSSLNSLSSHDPRFSHCLASKLPAASFSRVSCSTLRVQELSMEEPLDLKPIIKEPFKLTEGDDNDSSSSGQEEEEEDDEEEEEDMKGISRINVSREKYIPVSKSELLDKIVSELFDSQESAHQFHELCSCLDSILHAEHKSALEEMRRDYNEEHRDEEKLGTSSNEKAMDKVENSINGNGSVVSSGEEMKLDMPMYFDYGGLYLRNFLGSSMRNEKIPPNGKSILVVASRFQRAFMQLLNNAQFQELSARDLMLTSALNSDYLLTLPIYVDWKKASESNAIIFRRGYATERQKGLMLVEKLDYVQSRLLRAIFLLISEPLGKVGLWMKESIRKAIETQEVQDWVKELAPRLERLSLLQQSYFNDEKTSDKPLEIAQLSDSDLPIWLAAQRAVSRYEGFLSPVGPRGRLLRRLLTWIGAISPTEEEKPFEVDSHSTASEPHLRPIFLSRISLSDIWRPATRKFRRNNFWKKLKASFSIFLSQSELQEPAFQELILLYTEEMKGNGAKDNAEVPSLQLKIYEKIPIPDLPVVFPHKKLSFRIIDTVRLDAATILGLSAYFINYKFESISSSPYALFRLYMNISYRKHMMPQNIICIFKMVSRVVLGYKQTWDRYQLLVNRTLYEKTLASGFGSVHFLLDASEQQQYKEAILTYAILLKAKNAQVSCPQRVGDECERFLYNEFKVKVEMPVDKALNTLARLGLVTETHIDGRIRFQAIPCRKAREALRERWNNLLY